MKKILLIGKTGQLGSEIIKDAFSFGFEIVGFEQEELDVTNHLQVKEKIEKIKPNIVINTSAYQVVSMCQENPMVAMEINFIAVLNLARICKENDIIFITYSSDYVFDGTKGVPNEEDDAPNPLQMYGMSKLAGEYAALHAYPAALNYETPITNNFSVILSKFGLEIRKNFQADALRKPENSIKFPSAKFGKNPAKEFRNSEPDGVFIIRTCGLYGGKIGSPQKGNFVLNIIKEAQDKKVVEVSVEQMVSPTYAGDLSRATLKLLNSKAKFGIYHLVSEGECSWYEFTQEIFKLAGITKELKPINRSGVDGKIKRPKFSALKNTKAKVLGIVLPFWQEGLKAYFEFLKK